MILKGTVQELEKYIPWEELCKLISVDYYKRGLCEDEVFTVRTGDDKKRHEVMAVIGRILDDIGMHHVQILDGWIDDIIRATK